MDHEKLYESWKQRRAAVEAPADFSDRVMASIQQARSRRWRIRLKRWGAQAARSKIVQIGVCSAALLLWLFRLGALFMIFVP